MNKIIVTTKILSKVTPKYPELYKDTIEQDIKKEYSELLELEDKISDLRNTVRTLEEDYNKKKEEFHSKTQGMTLEYETYEKEIIKSKDSFRINNLGNETLGSFSS